MAKPLTIKTKKTENVRSTVPVKDVTKEPSVRLNLNIAPTTRNAWKRGSLDLNVSMTDMIHAAVEEYLATHLKK